SFSNDTHPPDIYSLPLHDALPISAWERAAEHVLVTDANGIVFLASDAAYKYHSIGGRSPPPDSDPDVIKRYPGVLATPIDFAVLERRGSNSIIRGESPDSGNVYLYQTMHLPEYGWTIHRLADLTSVREDQRDGAIIGGATAALIISLLLYIAQRHRAYMAERAAAARLKAEVAERTRELSES